MSPIRLDLAVSSTAVDHLHSTVLVVLGHQKCGAVAAACSGDKMPSRNLEAIVDRSVRVTQAKTYAKPMNLLEAAVKENVHQSAKDVLANSEILRDAVKAGKLTVIEAEYQFDSGAWLVSTRPQAVRTSHSSAKKQRPKNQGLTEGSPQLP